MRAMVGYVAAICALSTGAACATATQDPGRIHRPDASITMPRLVKEVKPEYTRAANQARIEGTVSMEAVVLPDGTVGPVRVTRSLDAEHGLDEQAVKTVKQWKFEPGTTKEGKAVPVLVEIEMTFKLRRNP